MDLYNNSDIPVSVQSLTELLRLPRPMPQGAPVYVTEEAAYYGQVYEPVPGVTAYESLSNPHAWWVLLFSLGAAGLHVVANLTALRNVPTWALSEGGLWYVLSNRAHYTARTLTWYNQPQYDEYGQVHVNNQWVFSRHLRGAPCDAQQIWFLDPVAGNNESLGDSPSTAVKTGRELSLRLWHREYGPNRVHHIYLMNGLAWNDVLHITGRLLRNAALYIHGSTQSGRGRTVEYTGTLGAKTDAAPAAPGGGTRGTVTDAAGGSWLTKGPGGTSLISTDASPNHRITVLSHASGTLPIAWPQKDIDGLGQVAVSQWTTGIDWSVASQISSLAEVTVAGDEQFVVERLLHVPHLYIEAATDSWGHIIVDSLDLLNSDVYVSTMRCGFWGCCGLGSGPKTLGPGGPAMQTLFGCCQLGSGPYDRVQTMGAVHMFACHQTQALYPLWGEVIYNLDTIAQGCSLTGAGWLGGPGDSLGGHVVIYGAASFDSPGFGLEVGVLGVNVEAGYLWGTATAEGVCIVPAGILTVDDPGHLNLVSATPLTNDFNLGGTVTNARTFDEALGSPSAVYATSWANLRWAYPFGLGGNCRNYVNDARIVSWTNYQPPPPP